MHHNDKVMSHGGGQTWEDKKRILERSNSNVRPSTNGVRMPRWVFGIFGFLLISSFVINSFITSEFQIRHFVNTSALGNYLMQEQPVETIKKHSGYLVRNEGCRIAAFSPFDPSSMRFIEKANPIKCKFGNQMPLVDSNDIAIFINPQAVYQYYNDSITPDCCWRSFYRKTNEDNAVEYSKDCIHFVNSTKITAEFIKVECHKNGKQIYRDYFASVPFKADVEKTIKDTETIDSDRLSLLMVGLDSVSRLNFHRMMPKTVNALKNLDAIELLGYNKVGDNTFPNLVAVLSGLSESELQKTCWLDYSKTFDECPFIWKNFSDYGYRTLFAEDACAMTTFNYLKRGFLRPPTDYYYRPFCVAAENDIGNTRKLNSNLCLGTRNNYETLLQYTLKAATRFNDKRYFGFFWQASLTHDFFNYPQLGDNAYSNFFEILSKHNYLNNTALIVMSDHGLRWGEYRQTYQGRMEESLPFVFIVLPVWWKNKYPLATANMMNNVASLTTPYDLHETLLDILEPRAIIEEKIKERNLQLGGQRGISWFLKVPNSRTCDTAGIPEHFCMCHRSNNITHDDPAVKITTNFLVDELNRLVKDYPQCSDLRFKELIDAKIWMENDKEDKKKKKKNQVPWRDLTITVQTDPGLGIFEASIRYNGTHNKLLGSISRLNAYGKQSACVDNFHTRLYCYCK